MLNWTYRAAVLFGLLRIADGGALAQSPEPPKPTQANVACGAQPRQVLDFYQGEKPGF